MTAAEDVRRRLQGVVDSDEAFQLRLTRSGTSVEFRIAEDPEAAVTLLLDRFPPRVADLPEPADVTIALSVEQARRFIRGELNLPSELAVRATAFRGPVRRFLAVEPILRHRLAEAP